MRNICFLGPKRIEPENLHHRESQESETILDDSGIGLDLEEAYNDDTNNFQNVDLFKIKDIHRTSIGRL